MRKQYLGHESQFGSWLQVVLAVSSCVSQVWLCRLGSALGRSDLLGLFPFLVLFVV